MSALAEFVASLPAWVRFGPALFYPLLSLGVMLPLTWLLEAMLLRPWRRLGADAHWALRARESFPIRARLTSWVITAPALVAMVWILWLGRLTPVDVAIAPAVAVLLVAIVSLVRVTRLVAPHRPRLTWRGFVGMIAMGGASLVLLLVIGASMPDELGPRAWLLLAVALIVITLWSIGVPTRIAASTGLYAPASPSIVALVEASASRAGVRAPGVFVADLPTVNAFALLVSRHLVLTKSLVEGVSEEGLAAVIDHEMGHFGEPPRTVALRVASSLVLVPLVLVKPLFLSVSPYAALGLAAVVATVALVSAKMRRRLEEHAGVHAATPEQAQRYAGVLERIYELNAVPAVLAGRVHPALYDRLLACGVTPDFPRPAPPPRRVGPMFAAFALALLGLVGPRFVFLWLEVARGLDVTSMLAVIGATGGDASDFAQLGYARFVQGDLDGAELAYAATAELEPFDPEPIALVARLRVMQGDCRGAAEAAFRASELAALHDDPRQHDLVRNVRRELESCSASR